MEMLEKRRRLAWETGTLPRFFVAICREWLSKHPGKVYMRKKDRGIWVPHTYAQAYEHVRLLCAGLLSLGIQRGDRVGILGDSEPEWFWAEYAIQSAGGIMTGLFRDAQYAELRHLCAQVGVRFVFARDQEQVDKMLLVANDYPGLQKIVYWEPEGLWDYNSKLLISFGELEELGRRHEKIHPDAFEQVLAQGKENDISLIMFTSGTTKTLDSGIAKQKGAIYTFASQRENAFIFAHRSGWKGGGNWLSFLPPSMAGEQILAFYPPLLFDSVICFPESLDTLANDRREIGPEIMLLGGAAIEGIAGDILARLSEANFIERFLYDLFLSIASKSVREEEAGRKVPWRYRIPNSIGDLLTFKPICERLGFSKCRYVVVTATSMSSDTFRYMRALGIPLRNMLMGTELGIPAMQSLDDHDTESVGKISPGYEAKLSLEGELLYRGKGVSPGYYNDPETTREFIDDDGWGYSNDAGQITEDNRIILFGRMVDAVELASGEKIFPTYVEDRVRFSPYVELCLLICGKEFPFVSALLAINFEVVGKWAERNHIPYTTIQELSQKEEVFNLIVDEIKKMTSHLPEYQRIKKMVVLGKELDPDDAEITRGSMKMRRKFLTEHYKNIIDAVYAGKDSVNMETIVRYRDLRSATITIPLKVREL
jgi:long-chain acyl-CoA synthetase